MAPQSKLEPGKCTRSCSSDFLFSETAKGLFGNLAEMICDRHQSIDLQVSIVLSTDSHMQLAPCLADLNGLNKPCKHLDTHLSHF